MNSNQIFPAISRRLKFSILPGAAVALLTSLLIACSSSQKSFDAAKFNIDGEKADPQVSPLIRNPAAEAPTFDPRSFEMARQILSYAKSTQEKFAKTYVESNAVDFLQRNPPVAQQDPALAFKVINANVGPLDTTKFIRLIPPMGQSGYSELTIDVSHAYSLGGKRIKPADLVKTWVEFINRAQKEIVLNVFDFDLMPVADVLVAKAQAGLKVRVGIDKNVIAARPEVLAVHDKLVAGGVSVTQVNSVSLNHQKMVAIDWSDPALARALFSSGNLTQSCLGPEGDLKDMKPRPKESIPNANHVITMKSWLAANLINHELAKVLDAGLQLRGEQYPTTGAYQITGTGVDPQTADPYPFKSFIVSFTPGGGYRSINQNILARLLADESPATAGPVRLVQFAYSAQDVSDALLKRAMRDFKNKGRFDFIGIGDTPFAMQGWSQFLKMSGLKRLDNPEANASLEPFQPEATSPWVTALTPVQLATLRSKVKIAPDVFGNHKVPVAGKMVDVTSKIHHKLMSVGEFAVIGTSFNFSESAETNNEQVLVFRDPTLARVVGGIADTLAKNSLRSVYQEALRRNAAIKKAAALVQRKARAAKSATAESAPPAQPDMFNDKIESINEAIKGGGL